MRSIAPTLFWIILLVFGTYNFLGPVIGIGMMSEMTTVTPKLYWMMIFPMGLLNVFVFSMLTWFGINDIIWEIKYNG